MVEHKIAPRRAGVPRSASMTPGTITNSINLGAFFGGPGAAWSARWDRFARKGSGTDAHARKLAGACLGLFRLGFQSADLPLGGFVNAWPRPPIWISFANAGNCFVCSGLGDGQAR